MKLREGNSYVCIKECKDVKGRKILVGAICYTSKGILLHGYNEDGIYAQVESIDDYEEYFTLYEESPYNKEQRELRERYAGLAMQAIISDHEAMNKIQIVLEEIGYQYENDSAVVVAKLAVSYADALIEKLRKEE